MAGFRIKNTIYSGGASGRDSNAGRTLAHRKGKNYSVSKKFTPPSNPNTIAQQLVRQSFSNLSAHWSQLTDEQRETWNLASASTQWQNSDGFDGNTSLTGKALYVGVNTRLLANGLPEVTTADKAPVIITDGIVAEFTALNKNQLSVIDVSCVLGSVNEKFILSITAPFSAGTNPANKKTTILLKAVDFAGGTNDYEGSPTEITFLPAFIAKYGPIVSGKKGKIELFVINTTNGYQKKVWSNTFFTVA